MVFQRICRIFVSHKRLLLYTILKYFYIIFVIVAFCCTACDWKITRSHIVEKHLLVEVKRYDQLEIRYLTTGDFSALQDMQTEYPQETRALIENVLQLGAINEPGINSKLLTYFQDTLLQRVISDVEEQYSDISDINKQFSQAFRRMQKLLPGVAIPTVYVQVGSLAQSILISDSTIGICLDKYLGKDYPLYKRYYTPAQRESMERDYIVPDCITFYLFSVFPYMPHQQNNPVEQRLHDAAILWAANRIMGKSFFDVKEIQFVEAYMKKNPSVSLKKLLQCENYGSLLLH